MSSVFHRFLSQGAVTVVVVQISINISPSVKPTAVSKHLAHSIGRESDVFMNYKHDRI